VHLVIKLINVHYIRGCPTSYYWHAMVAVISKHSGGNLILTAVVMKSTAFRDMTSCIPLKVNRRFGGKYRPHLQGRRINKHESPVFHLLSRWFPARFIRADSLITIDNAATALGSAHGLAYSIMHDRLKFRKVCTRWVHREMKDREKMNRMGLSL
jgi:hypothetical protein